MNLKQARYFITIIEEGSITAAAKKLYVTQPSLSQMLRQIEAECGTDLLVRTPLPMRPTYAGEKYLECARAIILANEKLENQLKDIRNENSGHLRLGISMQRVMRIFPRVLPYFASMYPDVTLELREAGSAKMEEYLRYGDVDLAFAAMESTSARFDYKLIEKETTGIIAGRNTKLAELHEPWEPIDLESARDERFISLKQGHSIRVLQDQLFRIYDMEPKVILETDSLEMAKRAAITCDACMLCPHVYFDETVAHQGVFFPLKNFENRRHYYACWRKGETLPRYAKDLIDLVCRELEHSKVWEQE